MREDEDALRSHTQFCASCKVGVFVFRSFPVLSAKFFEVFCVFFSNIVPINYSSLDFLSDCELTKSLVGKHDGKS